MADDTRLLRLGSVENLKDELRRTNREVARFIRSTCDFKRDDRCCPADYSIFSTNPLNLSFGAAGIALFLKRESGRVPGAMRDWILQRPPAAESTPPGLAVGLSGIAYALSEIGWADQARQVMEETYASPLLFDEANLFHGAAGWGWASLYFHRRTGLPRYLDKAVEAGDFILEAAAREGGGCFWKCRLDDRLHYGYAYGASGIALFLLHLYDSTAEEKYLRCARRAMAFELDRKVVDSNGWTWHRFEDDFLTMPYWQHGSAGVGTTLIRFYEILGERRYRSLAEKVAENAFAKFTVFPTLFEGLAGIADFLLDMHRATGKESYWKQTLDCAESILLYRVYKKQGIAFPGRHLLRLSNDLATGSAGVGLFFQRVLSPAPRLLVDPEPSEVSKKGESYANQTDKPVSAAAG